MTISPLGPSYNSAIQWNTLHIEPVYVRHQAPPDVTPVPAPTTPQAVATETARLMANQMASMPMMGAPVVAGTLAPAVDQIRVGAADISISPALGTNSWGF